MKNLFLIALAMSLFMGFKPGTAQALTMADVGSVDVLTAWTTVNSGAGSELDWINKSVFGVDYLTNGSSYFTSLTKTDTPSDRQWVAIDDNNPNTRIYAFDFVTEQPTYFFIKTASSNKPGAATGFDHYLYTNIGNSNYGVIDLNMGNLVDIYSVGKLSHVGEVGSAPVPEPTTMLLFGTGLLGLAAVGRRKR